MKVGLVGVGERLSYIVRIFHKYIPDFDIIAYSDPTPAKLSYLERHGIGKLAGYDRLDAMLEAHHFDLVMVGSPNHFHLEHIALALESGARVFAEKPVVISEEETFTLLELLQTHGVDRVMVGLVLRYSPLYRDLMTSIHDGTIGTVVSIEATEHIAPAHGAFFMRDWRRKTHMTGGFMLEKCCHDLDLYQSVIGARAKRVASFGGRGTFTKQNSEHADADVYHHWKSRWNGVDNAFDGDADIVDHQQVIIEYENGAKLGFHTSLNAPDEHRRFCVFGQKGMAEGDFVRAYYKTHDALTSEKLIDKTYDYSGSSVHYGAEELMVAEMAKHFYEGCELPVSVLDALEAGLTAIKIDEARETGSVVDLEDMWKRFDSFGLR